MCGIAGFTAPDRDAGRILAAMNAALAHRGPDGDGVFVDADIALGHTRLAIIDLEGGAQPRVDPISGDALTYNGEIYGYRALADELRASGVALRDRSDTEVLFQLIRRDGVRRAVERVDGMFAFAFRDGHSGALHLVRDRFGEKPLYYGLAGRNLVFASEVAALRCHPAFRDAMPDREAAYGFLVLEYCPRTVSGWTGIRKLEPGHILTFRDGHIAVERYWQPRLGTLATDAASAAERLDGLLADAVRRRLVADVSVGVFLSGGLDSSLLAALAARASPRITAFSVRVEGSGFDETPHAAAVAKHLGLPHRIVELGDRDLLAAFDAIAAGLGEPLADSSLLPTYLVCHAARQSMKVALGGDGADELFAGYPNFATQRLAPAMRLVPASLGRQLTRAMTAVSAGSYMNWRFLLGQLAQGFGADAEHQSFLWMAPFDGPAMNGLWRRSAMPEGGFAAAFAPIDGFSADLAGLSPVDRLLATFLGTYLPDDILTKTDRASMLNGIEVRAPFLDRHFAEYACALPARLKLRGTTRKYILKQVARRYLPESIVQRRKHGFAVPIGALIRTLFWERCRDVLLSSGNPVAGWFERAAIEALLSQHRDGRRDHGKKIWALYSLFAAAAQQPPRLTAALPAAALPAAAALG